MKNFEFVQVRLELYLDVLTFGIFFIYLVMKNPDKESPILRIPNRENSHFYVTFRKIRF